MTSVRVIELISVAGQPDAAGFAAFAAVGFAAVINARLDGEEPGQPGTTAEKASAA
ncbi:beta-lactamase hydrolase domain-containing protein, partial [Rhizobium ruizarguesonis]